MKLGVTVEATKLAERYFKCEYCGTRGEVRFHAVGKGYSEERESSWRSAHVGAGEAAQRDLENDEERVLGLVPCPTCEKRAPLAIAGVAFRVGFWLALAVVGMFVFDSFAFPAVVCGAIAGYFAWREIGRFRRARDVTIVKIVKPRTGR